MNINFHKYWKEKARIYVEAHKENLDNDYDFKKLNLKNNFKDNFISMLIFLVFPIREVIKVIFTIILIIIFSPIAIIWGLVGNICELYLHILVKNEVKKVKGMRND